MLRIVAVTVLFSAGVDLAGEVFVGAVTEYRAPGPNNPGLVVIKLDAVTTGKNRRLVREKSFVFAPHLAEGRHLPQKDKHYRRRFPHFPADLKKGQDVIVDFQADEKGRLVIQGLKIRGNKQDGVKAKNGG